MKTRKLGSDGPEISVVGFGSWAVGGPYKFGWGPTDDEESIAAIHHALNAGINWIDTAAVYGLGHSEEVVGRALGRQADDEILVFTKCGGFFKPELGKVVYDLRPESIAMECEASLRRLDLETIDLYQIHWPDNSTGTEIEDSWAAMSSLMEEGKVRWIGVSNFDTGLLDRCEALHHVTSLQPPLSLAKPQARDDVIPWAMDRGSGVLAYSSMASGLLSGKYDHQHFANLPPDDWRRNSAAYQEPELTRIFNLVECIKPLAEALGTTLPVLAVAWTLAVTGVTAAIVGARSPEQVDGWIGAASLHLDSSTLEELERCIVTPNASES
jgi:aryl-alcohol dehydrogenase-like predicted oxidoreductase